MRRSDPLTAVTAPVDTAIVAWVAQADRRTGYSRPGLPPSQNHRRLQRPLGRTMHVSSESAGARTSQCLRPRRPSSGTPHIGGSPPAGEPLRWIGAGGVTPLVGGEIATCGGAGESL